MKLITKEELMRLVIYGEHHECFDHEHYGTFDITETRKMVEILGGHLQAVSLDQIVPFIREQRVTEEARIDGLHEDSWKHDPGIFLVVGETDGVPDVVMVDGHHRALRREKEGCEDMQMWFIPIENAIRPQEGWAHDKSIDWGDKIENGKIIKR